VLWAFLGLGAMKSLVVISACFFASCCFSLGFVVLLHRVVCLHHHQLHKGNDQHPARKNIASKMHFDNLFFFFCFAFFPFPDS
jgi:hypothetical protein